MLGRVLEVGQKSFFPIGYKIKTGSLIKGNLGQAINIPSNVIPLSLKVIGHIVQENRSSSAVGYVRDNNGKELIRFEGIANEQARDDAYVNTTIDLMNLYTYNFDLMKSITSFNNVMVGSYNQTILEITSWLEKASV